jgi:hypothetical protein
VPEQSDPAGFPLASDERFHRRGPGLWWGETWAFDAASPSGDCAVFHRLTVYPARNVAWFCAGVVVADRPYVLCRDDGLSVPTQPLIPEVRGISLWSHLVCETPFDHWTVAMEAYAVAFDDPGEAWGNERGERVGLAFDLEWEQIAATQDCSTASLAGYRVPCQVNGDLQLDDLTVTIAGHGHREHRWGILDRDGWYATATDAADGSGPVLKRAPYRIDLSDEVLRAQMILRRDATGQPRWSHQVS